MARKHKKTTPPKANTQVNWMMERFTLLSFPKYYCIAIANFLKISKILTGKPLKGSERFGAMAIRKVPAQHPGEDQGLQGTGIR